MLFCLSMKTWVSNIWDKCVAGQQKVSTMEPSTSKSQLKKPTLHNISGCNAIPLCNLEFFAPGVRFKSWFQNLTLSQFKPVGDFSISIRIGSGNATRKLPPRRGWSFCSALPHHLHLLPQHIFVRVPLLQPNPPPLHHPPLASPQIILVSR